MPEKNSTTLSSILAESVAILLDSVFANSGRLLRVLIKFGAYKSWGGKGDDVAYVIGEGNTISGNEGDDNAVFVGQNHMVSL
jgi:hypothetical protein